MTGASKIPPRTALVATVASDPGAAASADLPIVVDLFQSQRGLSCAPANAMPGTGGRIIAARRR